jgi:hypothetical protein
MNNSQHLQAIAIIKSESVENLLGLSRWGIPLKVLLSYSKLMPNPLQFTRSRNAATSASSFGNNRQQRWKTPGSTLSFFFCHIVSTVDDFEYYRNRITAACIVLGQSLTVYVNSVSTLLRLIKAISSRKMSWAGHVVCMRRLYIAYIRNFRRDHFRDLDVDGRVILKVTRCKGLDWILLAQKKNVSWFYGHDNILRILQKARNFLTTRATFCFLIRNLLNVALAYNRI